MFLLNLLLLEPCDYSGTRAFPSEEGKQSVPRSLRNPQRNPASHEADSQRYLKSMYPISDAHFLKPWWI